MNDKPVVAVVGRPNVGKSTLFNRLVGGRVAIVEPEPGVTRDRIYREAEWNGREFVLVDTGGVVEEAANTIEAAIKKQVAQAIEEANLVLFVVDALAGVLPEDRAVAGILRRSGKPVLLIANKVDRFDPPPALGEFYALGMGEPLPVSAAQGLNTGDLLDTIVASLPAKKAVKKEGVALRVAVVGRPNAGKSSLVNAILGEERVIVSETPGTTRDAVDTPFERGERRYVLIDTAGIRRKGRTERGVEVLSVVMARKAIERAQVCLLVVDGSEGVTAQDAHVAGLIQEAGKGVVVVVNKADTLTREGKKRLLEDVEFKLKFLKDTPCLFVSALTGAGVGKLLPQALKVGENFQRRIGTGELNRVLRAAWESHPPPGGKGPAKLYYATQVGTAPPRFKLFTNLKGELHFSYLRFLENALRQAFPLAGVPVRFMIVGKP